MKKPIKKKESSLVRKLRELEAAQKQELQVPYDSLMGKTVTKPILPFAILQKVEASMIPFARKIRWERWGMDEIRKLGGAILLHGKSGTGKTTIARYIAKKLGKGIIEVTMADLGGSDIGQTERNSRKVFDKGREMENCVIYFDECDAILWSRDKAGPDTMWMLGVVNELLMLVERYEGVVILSTNMAHILDPALQRRLSDVIEVPIPDGEARLELWKAKMPSKFPLDLTPKELEQLAAIPLTGAEIENAIISEAKAALQADRKPKFQSLCNIAKDASREGKEETGITSRPADKGHARPVLHGSFNHARGTGR